MSNNEKFTQKNSIIKYERKEHFAIYPLTYQKLGLLLIFDGFLHLTRPQKRIIITSNAHIYQPRAQNDRRTN